METVEIPDGLAAMTPGPGLAAVLGGVDLSLVANERILDVLRAQYRQLCHEQARMLAVIGEVGRCDGATEAGVVTRLVEPDPYAADETRAALRWTRRAAETEHDLAQSVLNGMPGLFTAWLAGDIDRPRARVFERHLAGLDPAQVERICEVAVPRASELTTGQLANLLRRMVISVDPDAAARWYRHGVRGRNVSAYLAHDGTVTITANGLAADEAEAACVRVQDLASAAKRAGHRGPIAQIRADIFLGLLDGRFHHMNTEQIITTLITNHEASHHTHTSEPAQTSEPATSSVTASATSAGHAGHAGSGHAGADHARAGDTRNSDVHEAPDRRANHDDAPANVAPIDVAPNDVAPNDAPANNAAAAVAAADVAAAYDGPDRRAVSSDARDGDEAPAGDAVAAGDQAPTGDGSRNDAPTGNGACPSGASVRDERVGIEVRVGLGTLLGHDEHPGEIPGLGLLLAPQARARAAQQRRAQWRFAVTDTDGHLLSEGLTRRRPHAIHGHPVHHNGPPAGIVELHIPETLLRELLTAGHTVPEGWAPVIADIATQHHHHPDHVRGLDCRPDQRLPGPALRRHTEIRDRTCTFIGCRRPARACDQDHTIDHAHAGPTTTTNLGPACPHDHDLKHHGGWTLTQPQPGTFIWHSKLGAHYQTRGEFLHPTLPAPTRPQTTEPRATTPRPQDPVLSLTPGRSSRANDHPILRRPNPQPTPPPTPTATPTPPVGDPPF